MRVMDSSPEIEFDGSSRGSSSAAEKSHDTKAAWDLNSHTLKGPHAGGGGKGGADGGGGEGDAEGGGVGKADGGGVGDGVGDGSTGIDEKPMTVHSRLSIAMLLLSVFEVPSTCSQTLCGG